MKNILDAIAEPGKTWTFSRRDQKWMRYGSPKLAAYREPGHDDYLFIKDVDICADLAKKNKAIGF